MKHFFIALLSLITVSSFGQRFQVKEFFKGQPINGLIVNGAFEVKLKQGKESIVKVSATESRFEKINATISENGIVNLNFGTDLGKYFKSNKPLVEVTLTALDMLSVGGAVDVVASGEFSSNGVCSISVEGNSFLEFLNITAPSVAISSNAAATVREITIDSPSVTAITNGASVMMIRGKCDKLYITTQNTSSLNTLLMDAKDIEASCFGLSSVKAVVNGVANVTTSGTAAFRYMGDGKITGKASKL